METFYLYPSEIRFSRQTVDNFFSNDSEHGNVRIGETLDDLCEGRILVENIPTITVCKPTFLSRWFGIWISPDNRRLWVFRHLERHGKCDQIRVRKVHNIPAWNLTGEIGFHYASVTVNGDPGGRWHSADERLFLIGIGVLRELRHFIVNTVFELGKRFGPVLLIWWFFLRWTEPSKRLPPPPQKQQRLAFF